MGERDNLIRLSGLWAHKQADGSMVLTGNLGGARVVVLPIRGDKTSPKSPDYALYVGSGDGKQQGEGWKQGNRASGQTQRHFGH